MSVVDQATKASPHHLSLTVGPLSGAQGAVRLPGSKSISNRTLLLAALSEGVTEVRHLLDSDDTTVMRNALTQLGVTITQASGDGRGPQDVCVIGCAGQFTTKRASIFLGNAGTAARPLTAVLALTDGEYQLHGVPRMHERPIGDLVDALRVLGAQVTYLGNPGFPPLQLPGLARTPSTAVDSTLVVPIRGDVSSQFLSALLMALPMLKRAVTVEIVGALISKPYVEITLNLMARFGVPVRRDGWQRFHVDATARYRSPGVIVVEGDASSASYFLAAGAIAGCVRVEGVGKASIQGDVRFAEALEQMGAKITIGDDWIEAARPSSGLRAVDADLNHIPDAAMTIAVCALFASGTTTIRNIASWRVKETDRIAAMATELRKLGATVEEGADFISVTPPSQLTSGVAIDTYDDHRMAMCFSLAAFGGVPVTINDPNCVAKTFPDYFRVFAEVAK